MRQDYTEELDAFFDKIGGQTAELIPWPALKKLIDAIESKAHEPYVSKHAVERFMERSGVTTPEKALKLIQWAWDGSVSISPTEKFCRNGPWVIAHDNGVIKSFYKPTDPEVQSKVFKLFKKTT